MATSGPGCTSPPMARGQYEPGICRGVFPRAGDNRPQGHGGPGGCAHAVRRHGCHAAGAGSQSARGPDRDCRRAFRQLLHGQYARLLHGHGGGVRGPDRGPGLAGYSAHHRAGGPRPLPAPDRGHPAGRRRGIRPGVEIRPRHHGAAAFPDPALRPADHPGQYQLPGAAHHAAAPGLGFRPGAAQGLRLGAGAHRPGGYRRHLPLAGHA